MMSDVRVEFARLPIRAIASIVVATILVGCTGAVGVVTTPPPWWEPYLTVDRDLKMLGLREIGITRSRSESGFLRVAGEYLNRSDAKLSAIYRFTWLDASGQPVDTILANWQAVHALPRTRATFAGIAPRPDIEDFRVELLSAHRLRGKPVQKDSQR